MKVTGQQPPVTPELKPGKAREQGASGQATRRTEAEAPQGNANHTSLTMSRVRETIRNEPEVRTDRVDELKARIREGRYEVDPKRLSRNILTDALREDLEKP